MGTDATDEHGSEGIRMGGDADVTDRRMNTDWYGWGDTDVTDATDWYGWGDTDVTDATDEHRFGGVIRVHPSDPYHPCALAARGYGWEGTRM
jgi:hypothetical protein